MSYKGQYLRGEKWYHLFRDADGDLLPNVAEDENKMSDVKLYLEAVKKEKEEAAKKEETKSKEKK